MRNRRKFLVTASVAATLILGGGLSACTSITQTAQPNGVVHHIGASWAEAYPTIAAMTQHSTVVVVGKVVGIAGTGFLANNATGAMPANLSQVPYTDYRFAVSSAVKGTASGEIIVRQTGGALPDGSIVQVNDDPLMKVGDSDVLFLKSYGPSSYFIIGGPTGRLNVNANGIVSKLNGSVLTQLPTTLSALLGSVRSAIK